MDKLIKCQIAKERDVFIHCPGCRTNLKETPEMKMGEEPFVFLCPKCHHFFNGKGVIPFEEADLMFPGVSDISY